MENNEIKTTETVINENGINKKPYRRNNYRRAQQWREKPKAISYIKSFDNFNDGFTEVIRFNPELRNYCGDFGSYDAVIASMTKAINDNIPSPNNVNYPNTLSLSIDANEVGFKTDINIAIGWRIRYSYREGKTYFNFRVTFISIPVYKNNIIADMVEAGWKKLEKTPVHQNRYWNHIEGKDKDKKSDDGFKVKDLISDQKISTNFSMKMDKAYNEEDLEETTEIDNQVAQENKEASNLGVDKIFLNGEEISKEEAAEKMEEALNKAEDVSLTSNEEEVKTDKIDNDTIYSYDKISATANPNVFIIDHNSERRVVNVEEDLPYGDMIINKETHLISFADGVIFDYKNLNIIS